MDTTEAEDGKTGKEKWLQICKTKKELRDRILKNIKVVHNNTGHPSNG